MVKVISKTLEEIYPRQILLLVFTPMIIGAIIDFDLFDSRSIIISLIWIPILTIPIILFQKRFIYQLVTVLCFSIGLIELTHWLILKGPITTTSLLVLSNTNLQESLDFIHLKRAIELLLLIPYTFLFVKTIRKKYQPHLHTKTKPYVLGVVFIITVGFITENALNGRLVRKGVPQLAKVTFSFIDEIKLYKEVLADNHPKKIDANSTSTNPQTVVLVIGESSNRKHMSLYGATRKTTPKLANRKDLIVFDNVVSPYSNTINSVLSILSESNLENNIPFNKSVDIIDIFHSAEFKTYWISNQSPVGIWENLVTIFAKKSDYCEFVNTTSNSSFEATLTSSYDAKILAPFKTALANISDKKFIVVHLLGSHSSYKKRYPSEFNIFKEKTGKEETIAEYDNSILYNDFILDSLLKTVAQRKNESISFVYLSDHGENVYDELDKVGHDFSNELPKANVEIPFFVWLSKKYIDLHPQKVNHLKSNVHSPFVSDNLFHSLMDLNDIKSPYLKKKKSIFNKNYDSSRKRILVDGRDYDLKN